MSESIPVYQALADFRAYRAGLKGPVALVPTMGALHEGHASLVRAAREVIGPEGMVIASIFVNPMQFAPNEDFNKYPRTLEDDLELLLANGADAVFAPYDKEMYPAGLPVITVDPGAIGSVLEGAIRPTHFRGVCTVVLKLLNIILPHKLVMGQKDYQQNAVLKQMIRDLNIPTEHVTAATIREADGLAMSSRNRYLNADQRARAVGLYEALTWAKERVHGGEKNVEQLNAGMRQKLEARGLEVQYAVVVHADTLAPLTSPLVGPAVALIAVKNGATRLIDNMLLG